MPLHKGILWSNESICILDPGMFLIALRLAKLTVDEIKATFSQATLRTIQEDVCLEEETAVNLTIALSSSMVMTPKFGMSVVKG